MGKHKLINVNIILTKISISGPKAVWIYQVAISFCSQWLSIVSSSMETPQLFLLAAECWVPFLLLGWWMVQGYACVGLIDKESSKLTAFFLLRAQMIFFIFCPPLTPRPFHPFGFRLSKTENDRANWFGVFVHSAVWWPMPLKDLLLAWLSFRAAEPSFPGLLSTLEVFTGLSVVTPRL